MRVRPVHVVIAAAIAVASLAGATQAIDQRVPASASGTVEIENLAGSVKVTGWSQDEVHVTGTLGPEAERCEVTGSNGRVRVRVRVPDSVKQYEGSHLEVRIPAGSSLEVETVSADIEVTDVGGGLDLESVSGEVAVDGSPTSVEVSTVSGDISLASAPEDTDLESVSGSIGVREARGKLEAETVSGSIKVLGGALETLELSTTSGSIRCEADLYGHGNVEIESMSGEVALVVPAGISADFEIETFSGDIINQIGPDPVRTKQHLPGKELTFSAGSGGPKVSLSSFSGSVRLLTR